MFCVSRHIVWTRRGLWRGWVGPFTQLVIGPQQFSLRHIWQKQPYLVVERSDISAIRPVPSVFGGGGFRIELLTGTRRERFGGMDDEIAASFVSSGWPVAT